MSVYADIDAFPFEYVLGNDDSGQYGGTVA